MDIKIKYLLYLFCMLFLGCGEEATPPPSGYYGEDLFLATEPVGHLITGVYEKDHLDSLQSGPCRFYFTGKFGGRKSNLVRWSFGERGSTNTYGVLEMKDDHSFSFYWEEPLASCFDAPDFSSEEIIYHCTGTRKWRFVRTIGLDMVELHAGPDATTTVVDTIYKNSIVKVTEARRKWLKIETGSENDVSGWIYYKNLRSFPG